MSLTAVSRMAGSLDLSRGIPAYQEKQEIGGKSIL